MPAAHRWQNRCMSRASRVEALEGARILAEYRRLVLLGRVRVPLAEGRRLVGPDCAYHLYFRHADSRRVGTRRRSRRSSAGR